MGNELISAHQFSSNHRKQILKSTDCGCFYCLEIFKPAEIVEWVDDDDKGEGQTVICPKCGIDSVIGSESGYPIETEFLKKMKNHWF